MSKPRPVGKGTKFTEAEFLFTRQLIEKKVPDLDIMKTFERSDGHLANVKRCKTWTDYRTYMVAKYQKHLASKAALKAPKTANPVKEAQAELFSQSLTNQDKEEMLRAFTHLTVKVDMLLGRQDEQATKSQVQNIEARLVELIDSLNSCFKAINSLTSVSTNQSKMVLDNTQEKGNNLTTVKTTTQPLVENGN